MEKPTPKQLVVPILLSVLALGVAGAFYYQHKIYLRTQKTLSETQTELTSTQLEFQKKLAEVQKTLDTLDTKNLTLSESLTKEQERSQSVIATIGQVSQTVGTLQKLSKSDPELLKKYSKIYFLNEHYVPLSLGALDEQTLFTPNKPLQLQASVIPFMQKLFAAMASDAPTSKLKIVSSFRSFGSQAQLKKSYQFVYGAGSANQFSAEQGYSEHQLGTTVDFSTPTIGANLTGFEKSPEYAWLTANAYKYGFILSYPQNNKYYQYEPWHWRFVGVALATELHARGIYFYDMDQREIDTYLAGMFD